MKIVLISDTHGRFQNLQIPECDVLISCGDYSFYGKPKEVEDFHKWFDDQDAKYLISVQGNHEVGVESNFQLSKKIAKKACPSVYFIDEGLIEIEGVKIWCSAITPWFYDWAWNRKRGEQIKQHWDKIPDDTDILITHGPPYGILDQPPSGNSVGCEELIKKVLKLPKLKLHAFGHIHNSYGTEMVNGITFVNASICNEQYRAVNSPVVFEIPQKADIPNSEVKINGE